MAPGNENERFPDCVNTAGDGSVQQHDHPSQRPEPSCAPRDSSSHHAAASKAFVGRPASLSIQSAASSSDFSVCSSDKDTIFDSRRSSTISCSSSACGHRDSFYSTASGSGVGNLDSAGSPQQQHQHHASSSSSSNNHDSVARSRRDAKQLHAARVQRSGSCSLAVASKKDGASRGRKYQPSNPAEALAATEPPHEQGLNKMAFADQQRWITVQQKTFTKWLNTKLEARNLEVKDLVEDLSDGVSQAAKHPVSCLGTGQCVGSGM